MRAALVLTPPGSSAKTAPNWSHVAGDADRRIGRRVFRQRDLEGDVDHRRGVERQLGRCGAFGGDDRLPLLRPVGAVGGEGDQRVQAGHEPVEPERALTVGVGRHTRGAHQDLAQRGGRGGVDDAADHAPGLPEVGGVDPGRHQVVLRRRAGDVHHSFAHRPAEAVELFRGRRRLARIAVAQRLPTGGVSRACQRPSAWRVIGGARAGIRQPGHLIQQDELQPGVVGRAGRRREVEEHLGRRQRRSAACRNGRRAGDLAAGERKRAAGHGRKHEAQCDHAVQ